MNGKHIKTDTPEQIEETLRRIDEEKKKNREVRKAIEEEC